MINKELETSLFLEEAKNLCINTFVAGLETKQYIIGFNVIKDYETVNNKLVIGNGKYKELKWGIYILSIPLILDFLI